MAPTSSLCLAADSDKTRAADMNLRISCYIDRMLEITSATGGAGSGRSGGGDRGVAAAAPAPAPAAAPSVTQADVAALYALASREVSQAEDYGRRGTAGAGGGALLGLCPTSLRRIPESSRRQHPRGEVAAQQRHREASHRDKVCVGRRGCSPAARLCAPPCTVHPPSHVTLQPTRTRRV